MCLRKDIDWIDDQILDLLEQRYAVVKRVAWAKTEQAEQALAIRPRRETDILERLSGRAIHVPADDVARIWRAILSLSAHHQRSYRVIVSGPESSKLALMQLASARYGEGIAVDWVEQADEAIATAASGEAILMVPAEEWQSAGASGLDLIGQHATGCVEHPWALELGRLGRDERRPQGWTPTSWKGKVHQQLPAYPDRRRVAHVEQELRETAAIVPLAEVTALQALLADAQRGAAVVIQAGDCAEQMDAGRADVEAMAALIDALGAQLTCQTGLPAVRLGRIGGQYAKPRSQAADGQIPTYRGDAVNGRDACPVERTADPMRLLDARAQASRVRAWLPEQIHASHEALLLPYETALTRVSQGRVWAASAHSLWLGERTRDPEGSHVEYLRGIANPIGIKCGPEMTAAHIRVLLEKLDARRTPGRIMLVSRIGCRLVEERLPELMAAVREAGHEVLWLCDPMHGNNRGANGTKVRLLPEIIAEVEAFVRVARVAGVHPGGVAPRGDAEPRPRMCRADRGGGCGPAIREPVRPAAQLRTGGTRRRRLCRRDGVSLVSAATARIVAYLGGQGSFSEEACRRFVPAHELMPMADFASVAQAVAQGSADIAVLPVSNTYAGPIVAVHQLLAHPELRVVREQGLGVRLHLVGLPGATVAGIRRVMSHPAALTQCARYLGEREWERSAMVSTAEAARQVTLLNDPTCAAIASSEAAAAHGLKTLAQDLQGEAENVTRFAIVERRDQFA